MAMMSLVSTQSYLAREAAHGTALPEKESYAKV